MQNILGLWLNSLKHYVYMCILLSSPERLPQNLNVFVLTLLSYFLIGLFLVDAQRSYAVICAEILLELSMLGMIAYLGLRWKKNLSRLLQTSSALVGITMITTAVSLLLNWLLRSNQNDSDSLLIYVSVIILVWNLAVLSLILKRALEISTHLSAMISFNYFVLYQFIVYRFY